MDTLDIVTVPDLEPAPWSGFFNSAFRVWPQPAPVVLQATQQGYVCGGWRVVCGHDAASSPASVTASPADLVKGGLKLDIVFTAADQIVYLRQLSPDLERFAGDEFTATFRVESSSDLRLDYYARARWSADDNQRLPVIDTDHLAVPAGNNVVAASMAVPRLGDPAAEGWAFTDRNALESALRFWSNEAGTVSVTIRDATLVPGLTPQLPSLADFDDERDSVYAYEESGHWEETGWSDVAGQKRTWVEMADKAFEILPGHIQIKDMAGAKGKISLLGKTGIRYDGVVPTVIGGGAPGSGRKSGFSVILNNSTASGFTFDWYVRNYGEGEWST